jgi:hypothetical protein
MHKPTRRQSNGTGPDDRRPPRDLADDLAQLEDALQQLRQMLEAHATAPRWVPLQVTREAVALAHRLLHGWQVQQALTQTCLTRWQQTLETLETVGVALQRQAEAHQAQTGQLRRAPWWAFLAGMCLMALVVGWLGGRRTAPPPLDGSAWQTRRPVPRVPERVPPADERPSVAPAAPLTPGTHEAPSRDGL